jgi:hypothetical protein
MSEPTISLVEARRSNAIECLDRLLHFYGRWAPAETQTVGPEDTLGLTDLLLWWHVIETQDDIPGMLKFEGKEYFLRTREEFLDYLELAFPVS